MDIASTLQRVGRKQWPFIILGIIALLHILKFIQIDGYAIALLILAFLPILLPLIARYLDSLKLTKDGFEANIKADNEGKSIDEIEKRGIAINSRQDFANEKQPEFPFELPARRVLSTLWHYQKELFGKDSLRRWGFGVGIGNRDYGDFLRGVVKLYAKDLIYIDDSGLAYLTNQGKDFCSAHSDILDADGPFYTKFSPVD